jgi:hypothetical protein
MKPVRKIQVHVLLEIEPDPQPIAMQMSWLTLL